jgi:hypothetical protein
MLGLRLRGSPLDAARALPDVPQRRRLGGHEPATVCTRLEPGAATVPASRRSCRYSFTASRGSGCRRWRRPRARSRRRSPRSSSSAFTTPAAARLAAGPRQSRLRRSNQRPLGRLRPGSLDQPRRSRWAAATRARSIPARSTEDWEVDDPAEQDLEAVRKIRDEIDRRVQALMAELLPGG